MKKLIFLIERKFLNITEKNDFYSLTYIFNEIKKIFWFQANYHTLKKFIEINKFWYNLKGEKSKIVGRFKPNLLYIIKLK